MGEAVEVEMQEAEDGGARKRKREGEEEQDGGVEAEEEVDDGARYEGIAEEAVAEVMRWLEAEIAAPAAAAGSVTVNDNEEICGPSVSAAASTVMAFLDTRAGAPPPPRVPWPWPEAPQHAGNIKDVDGGAGTKQAGDAEMLGPGGEAEEEWLARLLTCCGPLLEGVL